MRNLYARLILWLIRPALMRHNGLAAGKLELTIDAPDRKRFFEAAIGGRDCPAWRVASQNSDAQKTDIGDELSTRMVRLIQGEIQRRP